MLKIARGKNSNSLSYGFSTSGVCFARCFPIFTLLNGINCRHLEHRGLRNHTEPDISALTSKSLVNALNCSTGYLACRGSSGLKGQHRCLAAPTTLM